MNWNNEELWGVVLVLFLGQLLSFVLSAMAFCASFITSLGAHTPLTLSFFSYSSLTLVHGGILIRRRRKLSAPWYWYLILGFFDVQANYLLNKAYQYTSITSVTILDCWTVAWVILLSLIALGTRYTRWQFFGAAVCVLGLIVAILSDAGAASGGGGGSKFLLGDTLAISATVFYALSNVGQEYCVKKKNRSEVIPMLSFFAVLVSVCQIAVLERKSLESVQWSSKIILAFVGYAVGGFTFHSVLPYVLKMSGATLFNLSILTTDMWAVVIRIFFYKQQVEWLYYVAFALVGIGLIIFARSDKSKSSDAVEDGDPIERLGLLDQENTESSIQASLSS